MRQYTIPVLQVLFLLNALVWIIFSIFGLVRGAEGVVSMLGAWLLSLLMAINGMIYLAFSLMVRRGGRLMFFGAAAFLLINILLGLMDQLGFLDFLFLAVNLLLMVLLVGNRRMFLSRL